MVVCFQRLTNFPELIMPVGTLRAFVASSAVIGRTKEYGSPLAQRCFRTYVRSSDVVEAGVPRLAFPKFFMPALFCGRL